MVEWVIEERAGPGEKGLGLGKFYWATNQGCSVEEEEEDDGGGKVSRDNLQSERERKEKKRKEKKRTEKKSRQKQDNTQNSKKGSTGGCDRRHWFASNDCTQDRRQTLALGLKDTLGDI